MSTPWDKRLTLTDKLNNGCFWSCVLHPFLFHRPLLAFSTQTFSGRAVFFTEVYFGPRKPRCVDNGLSGTRFALKNNNFNYVHFWHGIPRATRRKLKEIFLIRAKQLNNENIVRFMIIVSSWEIRSRNCATVAYVITPTMGTEFRVTALRVYVRLRLTWSTWNRTVTGARLQLIQQDGWNETRLHSITIIW